MEYKVVKASTLDDLVNRVNLHTGEEWIPTGGIAVNRGYDVSESFLQAMLRYPTRNGRVRNDDTVKD